MYLDKFAGNKFYVVNTTENNSRLKLDGERINVIMQAKDKNGSWKNIEYFVPDIDRSEFNDDILLRNSYREMTLPVYKGEFKTLLRVSLSYYNKVRNPDKLITIYSKPFEGSINNQQFWRHSSVYNYLFSIITDDPYRLNDDYAFVPKYRN